MINRAFLNSVDDSTGTTSHEFPVILDTIRTFPVFISKSVIKFIYFTQLGMTFKDIAEKIKFEKTVKEVNANVPVCMLFR